MRVLVACEYSGRVRQAFRDLGHDAWSCDLLDAEDGSEYHIKGDFLQLDPKEWDLLIAFPPCTDLAVSGARWFKEKQADGSQQRSIQFFLDCVEFGGKVGRFAIENPIGIMSSKFCKPTQIIQPWQFGHGETKATCLWLFFLPKLVPTDVVEGREQRIWKMSPGPDRWKERSRTFQGIANAMAEQWGGKIG